MSQRHKDKVCINEQQSHRTKNKEHSNSSVSAVHKQGMKIGQAPVTRVRPESRNENVGNKPKIGGKEANQRSAEAKSNLSMKGRWPECMAEQHLRSAGRKRASTRWVGGLRSPIPPRQSTLTPATRTGRSLRSPCRPCCRSECRRRCRCRSGCRRRFPSSKKNSVSSRSTS